MFLQKMLAIVFISLVSCLSMAAQKTSKTKPKLLAYNNTKGKAISKKNTIANKNIKNSKKTVTTSKVNTKKNRPTNKKTAKEKEQETLKNINRKSKKFSEELVKNKKVDKKKAALASRALKTKSIAKELAKNSTSTKSKKSNTVKKVIYIKDKADKEIVLGAVEKESSPTSNDENNTNNVAPVKEKIVAKRKSTRKLSTKEKIKIKLEEVFAIEKLKYPVQGGQTQVGFGLAAIAKGINYVNPGLTIVANENTAVIATFKGTIKRIYEDYPNYYTIIIEHDGFLSTYSGVKNVVLYEGDEVERGVTIGNLAYNPETEQADLEFIITESISKEGKNLNPANYLE
jgi:murein DD-endopeptidase MepM/ murein hydrolase activator NlpD